MQFDANMLKKEQTLIYSQWFKESVNFFRFKHQHINTSTRQHNSLPCTMFRILLLIVLIISLRSTGHVQQILEVDDNRTEHNFMPFEIPFFLDETNSRTFSEISSPGFSNRFKVNP